MIAVRVFVRGFESQANGEKIISVLERMGFDIADAFDGNSDTLGGLIETPITDFDHLSLDGYGDGQVSDELDPDDDGEERKQTAALIATIQHLVPSAFVQFDLWHCVGGDHSTPDYDGRFGCYATVEDEEDDTPIFGIVE